MEGPFAKEEDSQEFLGLEDILIIEDKSHLENSNRKHRKRSDSADSWGDGASDSHRDYDRDQ